MVQAKDHDLIDKHLGQTFASLATCINKVVQEHMICPSDAKPLSGKKRERDSLTMPSKADALRKVRLLLPIAIGIYQFALPVLYILTRSLTELYSQPKLILFCQASNETEQYR